MSISFTIQHDLDRVVQSLNIFGGDFVNELGDAVEDCGTVLLNGAIENCPSPTSLRYPTDSTGYLRDSHVLEVAEIGSGYQITVTNTADYAFFVHEGHQTVAARPWLDETAMEKEDELAALLNAKVDELIDRIFE
jgi:hypothetical protein